MRRRPDRRQAHGHPGDAARSRPGQQLPQYPGHRHRRRIRRVERPGCSVPDAAETAPVREALLHPRPRWPSNRTGANHRPQGGLDARSLAIEHARREVRVKRDEQRARTHPRSRTDLNGSGCPERRIRRLGFESLRARQRSHRSGPCRTEAAGPQHIRRRRLQSVIPCGGAGGEDDQLLPPAALQVVDRIQMQGARQPAAIVAAGHQDHFVVVVAAGLGVHGLH
jgi:hypothetical protein